MLASASNAIVLGFNVKADAKAAAQAQADGVDLRSYNVIYDAINDVKAALSGMLAPEIRETLLGRAQVRQLFPITKVGTIYGSSVTEGKMVRGARVRIKRGDTVLGESTSARSSGSRTMCARCCRGSSAASASRASGACQPGRRHRGLHDRGGRPDALARRGRPGDVGSAGRGRDAWSCTCRRRVAQGQAPRP